MDVKCNMLEQLRFLYNFSMLSLLRYYTSPILYNFDKTISKTILNIYTFGVQFLPLKSFSFAHFKFSKDELHVQEMGVFRCSLLSFYTLTNTPL